MPSAFSETPGEDEDVEVAVTRSARHEEVVGLRRLDAAKARTAALDVHDEGGKIRAREIRDALGLQGDARRR